MSNIYYVIVQSTSDPLFRMSVPADTLEQAQNYKESLELEGLYVGNPPGDWDHKSVVPTEEMTDLQLVKPNEYVVSIEEGPSV